MLKNKRHNMDYNKSDYRYEILGNVIAIVDLNLGRKSVTNNIENVLDEISTKEHLIVPNYIIIYKDSEGRWDGYNFFTKSFYSLTYTLSTIFHLKEKL